MADTKTHAGLHEPGANGRGLYQDARQSAMNDMGANSLHNTGANGRGLFDDLQEAATDAFDILAGVNQSDVADGRVDLSRLPRADRIELLVDGETSSIFGSSPWSIGKTVDGSVSDEIHANKGSTLVFSITADAVDALESSLRSVRYALVWDDSIVANGSPGVLEVNFLGQTFLVLAVDDEPHGRSLTLWVTDNDLKVAIVKQGKKEDANAIRQQVIKDAKGPDKDSNPLSDAFNAVTGFITTTQIGGLVALAVVAVLLVIVVRSEAAKELAKNTKAIL